MSETVIGILLYNSPSGPLSLSLPLLSSSNFTQPVYAWYLKVEMIFSGLLASEQILCKSAL